MSESLQSPGEAAVQPAWVELPPAMRAELLDPALWHEGLEAYAHTTNMAVALVDVKGRLLGMCINPRPTWSLLHARQPADYGCPFTLAPHKPCTCIDDALAARDLVLVRDRLRLVHFAVPLVLGDQALGALLAGQVFDQYPEQLPLERVAKQFGLSPYQLWQRARLELPVKWATLCVYGRLLATLGNAFLRTRYHTIIEAHRLDILEQRVQERTAALHHAMAERQRLEEEAHRVQHLALLGRLAAGVSHEIRNPLAALFLQVDLLEEELREPALDSPGQINEALAEIKTQLIRLEDLVQNYLSLVRVGNIQSTPQDLGAAVVAWVGEEHGQAAAHGVTIHLEGLVDLGPVAFHSTTLRRAVLNLVQNALDAMPAGGTLTLAGQRTATQVRLEVRDTGVGIAAERLKQIFEPLYTTKPAGTGLGLYIVQEIMAAHRGQVLVESREGQGTTFTLILLVATDDAAPDDAR